MGELRLSGFSRHFTAPPVLRRDRRNSRQRREAMEREGRSFLIVGFGFIGWAYDSAYEKSQRHG